MKTSKITTSDWYPEQKLLVTRISGDVDHHDISRWEQSLKEALARISDNSTFRIFVNLHGFTAIDLAAHKRFRDIIPQTLAAYGWKVGYTDLFEEAADITYTHTRGIRCTGAAHTHQDATKMALYESRFGRENEHFFTDPGVAAQWINTLERL